MSMPHTALLQMGDATLSHRYKILYFRASSGSEDLCSVFSCPSDWAAGIVVPTCRGTPGCLLVQCPSSWVISEHCFSPISSFSQCKCMWRTHYMPAGMIEARDFKSTRTVRSFAIPELTVRWRDRH